MEKAPFTGLAMLRESASRDRDGRPIRQLSKGRRIAFSYHLGLLVVERDGAFDFVEQGRIRYLDRENALRNSLGYVRKRDPIFEYSCIPEP